MSTDAPVSRTRVTASRERLFRAAVDLVGQHGPDHVTVDQIAAAAGVAKGTVYYQFGSKNDLVKALLDHGFVAMDEALSRHADEPDPMQAIEAMVRAAVDFLDEYQGYAKLWIGEMLREASPWRDQLLRMRRQLIERIMAALNRLGAADSSVDVAALAEVLFGATYVSGVSLRARSTPSARRAHVAAVMCAVRGYAGR